ncbi:MAG: GNAT family N-acetyltransferase [Frankiales bacterium]|nr:GNAT family N-acetyltransferase [Frankiales bacterium]
MTDPAAGGPLTVRPLRYGADGLDPVDLETVVGLVARRDLDVLGERDGGPSDVAWMLGMPTVDREATALILDGERPVAYVFVENDATARHSFTEVVAPHGPARAEAHRVGVAHGLAAARRHRDAAGGGEWSARAGGWVQDAELGAVLTEAGFTPVRRFHRMRIDSSSPEIPAQAPPLPEGVELVVSDDEATRRRICDVDNDAFRDHWDFTPRPWDEWWALWETSRTRDPEGWWLLTVDGEDAAICLLDDSLADMGDGFVALLGVRRPFRGRGLARLLLRRAFVRYRDLGRNGTQLGVDAENLTGAVALYEGVGMRPVRTFQSYARDLA